MSHTHVIPGNPESVAAQPVRVPQVALGIQRDTKEPSMVMRLLCDCGDPCGDEFMFHFPLKDAEFVRDAIDSCLKQWNATQSNSN